MADEGRPLLFKTPGELESAIEAYFESCWEEVWVTQRKLDNDKKPIKDDFGNFEMEWIPKLNREGKHILRQTKPYTLSGLALALNCCRQTLLNYKERPEFLDTIKKAKAVCEAFLEEGMLAGEIPAIPGIFNAKNNYGWADKTEIGLTAKVTKMDKITKDGQEIDFNVPDSAIIKEDGEK